MPGYGKCRSAIIDASPEECFAALTDYEHLPEWQGAVRSARIVEHDAQGRGHLVEYEVDAKVRTVRYTLEQVYDEPHRLGSRYVRGDFRDMQGEWRFFACDDGRTRAELDLRIDPGRFVPGPVRTLIAAAVMDRALADLERRFARARVTT